MAGMHLKAMAVPYHEGRKIIKPDMEQGRYLVITEACASCLKLLKEGFIIEWLRSCSGTVFNVKSAMRCKKLYTCCIVEPPPVVACL